MPTQSFPIPLADYTSISLPETLLPDWVRKVTLEIARSTTATPTIWPNVSTTVDARLEYSLDSGVNWIPGGGFTARGGIHTHRNGTQLTTTRATFNYPPGPVLIRGNVTIVNPALRTQGQLIVSDV